MTKLGDYVQIASPAPGGNFFEVEAAEVIDVGPSGRKHRYLVRLNDGETVERLIHPMSQRFGAQWYVAAVNAFIAEQARFDAIDAETVDGYAADDMNHQTTPYDETSAASQPPG